MTMSRREEQKEKERKNRAREWADEAKGGGFEATAVDLPQGLERYKLDEEGIHEFDIVPYICGWGNPKSDKGFEYWMRKYGMHRIPLLDGKTLRLCCLYETWGKPCPVCKKANSRGVSTDERTVLMRQLRYLILVNDKPGKVNNPLKLLDEVHYNRKLGFGEKLVSAIQMSEFDEDFSDSENGLTLKVNVADKKFHSVDQITFRKRSYSYPKNVVEEAPCLDDMLVVPLPKELKGKKAEDLTDSDWKKSYAEMERLMNGGESTANGGREEEEQAPQSKQSPRSAWSRQESSNGDDEDNEEEAPPPKKKKESAPAFEAGDEVEYEGEIHTVKRVVDDGTLILTDEDGRVTRDVEVSECSVPKKSSKKAKEDEEDEEEEEETPRPSKRK